MLQNLKTRDMFNNLLKMLDYLVKEGASSYALKVIEFNKKRFRS